MSHEKIDIGVFWQLKTLTDAKPSNGVYSYQIDRNLYDRHRKKDNTLRLIALLALPSKDAPWLEQTHEGMTIRRCLYWACLRGAPTVKAKGTGPVTIKFPTNQVLTPSVLLRIYEGLAIDEPLEEVIACCQKMNSSL